MTRRLLAGMAISLALVLIVVDLFFGALSQDKTQRRWRIPFGKSSMNTICGLFRFVGSTPTLSFVLVKRCSSIPC